jgi:spermidine synthase
MEKVGSLQSKSFFSFRLFKIHPASFLLGFSILATGACGLVFEYVLSTVSTYILGNAIEQFAVTFGLMMLMMGAGALLQRFLSDKNLVEKFIVIEISLAILGGYAPIAIYSAFGAMNSHFELVQYLFMGAIGFLIGLEIPVVLRINEKYSQELGVNLAQIISVDYVGAFIGSIVWAFFLIRKFSIVEIGFLVGIVNFLIAIIAFSYFLKKGMVKHKVSTISAILATIILISLGYVQSKTWEINMEQRLYEDPIVFSQTTKYQKLVMTRNEKLNEYRFFINGNNQFSSLDEAIYHEQLVHPIMSLVPDHRRVLILGGGDGLALREVLKYEDVESVTLVDLDPDMVQFCANNETMRKLNHNSFQDARVKTISASGIVSMGERSLYQETEERVVKKDKVSETEKVGKVNIFNLDADLFLDRIIGYWNVIIVDFPDPNAVELTKLYSQEFYFKLKRKLAENGTAVIQSTSPYHAKEAYLCVKRTVESSGFTAVPYHDNVPSFGDWGWIMAWKSSEKDSLILQKMQNINISVPTKYLSPVVFRSALSFGKGWLESNRIDVNTLMKPVLLKYYTHDAWLVD